MLLPMLSSTLDGLECIRNNAPWVILRIRFLECIYNPAPWVILRVRGLSPVDFHRRKSPISLREIGRLSSSPLLYLRFFSVFFLSLLFFFPLCSSSLLLVETLSFILEAFA